MEEVISFGPLFRVESEVGLAWLGWPAWLV
jgi:hypothetical protein